MANPQGHNSKDDPRRSSLFTPIHTNRQELIRPEKQTKKNAFTEPIMSARRELRLKHSKVRRNILIVLSIIIGLLLALLATDTIKLGTGPQPSVEAKAVPQQTVTTVEVAGSQIESLRTPTPEDPLRIYIAGDSLTGAYANTLATEFGNTGLVKPYYDYRPSSGLVNTDFFDWFKQSKSIASQYKPELVIFMIGTNDASIVSSNPNGYEEAYRELLKDLTDLFDLDKTKFVFILSPSMRDTKLDENVSKLNDVIDLFSQENKLQTVDAGTILSPTNKFSLTIKQGTKYISVRSDDGVHISTKGGEILSLEIFQKIVEHFDLEENFSSASNETIDPIKIKGCCSAIKSTATTAKKSTTTSSSTTSSTTAQDTAPDTGDSGDADTPIVAP